MERLVLVLEWSILVLPHSHHLGAQVVPPSETLLALPAAHSRLDRHSVPDLEPRHVLANLDDLARRLMAEDDVVRDAAVSDATALPEVDLPGAEVQR
jgi:hypothetical protein